MSKKKTAKLRLIAGKRVSTRKGREGESFHAPEMQMKSIEAWCEANDAEIVLWFDETDSVKGHTTDRPGLKAAMEAVMQGKADGIIVARIDRMARSLEEGMAAIRKLSKAKKIFISVDDHVDLRENARPGDKAFAGFLLTIAEWEWETRKEYWSGVRGRAIELGIPKRPPFGYYKTDTRRAAIDEDEAQWVRWLFDERLKRRSYVSLAEELNANKIPTRGAHRWNGQSVRFVLSNRSYVGELRDGEHMNPKGYPVIVSKAKFDRVQKLIGKPQSQASRGLLLSSIARCGSCGGKLAGNAASYRCKADHTWGRCPAPAAIGIKRLNEYVVSALVQDLKGRRVRSRKSTDALERAKEKLDAANDALDEFNASPTTHRLRKMRGEAAVASAMSALLDDVEEAEAELEEVERSVLGLDLPANVVDLIPVMPPEKLRALLLEVVPLVVVRAAGGGHFTDAMLRPEDRVIIYTADNPQRPKPETLPGRGGVDRIVRLAGPARARE